MMHLLRAGTIGEARVAMAIPLFAPPPSTKKSNLEICMYLRKFNSFQHCHDQCCTSTQLNAIFTEGYSRHIPRCKICHNTTSSLLDVTAHGTLLEDQLCSQLSPYWPRQLCSSFVKECLTPSITVLIVSSFSLPPPLLTLDAHYKSHSLPPSPQFPPHHPLPHLTFHSLTLPRQVHVS